MNAKEIEKIFAELITLYENLKAEVIIAELNESEVISSEDYLITNRSTFSRPYRRDIIDIDNLTYKDCLNFNLSRNGLYDHLPEGLFHKSSSGQDKQNYSNKRKKFKSEEQNARLFFGPLENEFFYQRLGIELAERELLDNFYNLKDEFVSGFWNILHEIPEEYLLKLIKILPFCYKISGDMELTRQCLEKVIEEPVKFKLSYRPRTQQEDMETSSRELQLGVDLTLNSDASIVHYPFLEVSIGPLSKQKINNFLKNDGILNFINTFYDYFMPMEVEVETKFTASASETFILTESDSALMGITTRI